jgi:hypothetical protein
VLTCCSNLHHSGRFVHLEVPDQLNAMIETFIAQL